MERRPISQRAHTRTRWSSFRTHRFTRTNARPALHFWPKILAHCNTNDCYRAVNVAFDGCRPKSLGSETLKTATIHASSAKMVPKIVMTTRLNVVCEWSANGLRMVCEWSGMVCEWSAKGLRMVCEWSAMVCEWPANSVKLQRSSSSCTWRNRRTSFSTSYAQEPT